MSDYYLKKYYQTVSGPGWPDVQTYKDILTLPQWQIDELRTVHNLDQSLQNHSSQIYWRRNDRHLSRGLKKNNLVFVPVLKCASTYFTTVFTKQLAGWEEVNLYDLDWEQSTAFGVMLHPLVRRIKGILQIVCETYDVNRLERVFFKDHGFRAMLAMTPYLDTHSMPYSLMYGDLLHKINWIPMEIGTKNLIREVNKILQDEQIEYPHSTDRSNRSDLKKQQLFDQLVEIMQNPRYDEFTGSLAFASDLGFYHDLLIRYTDLLEKN